MTTKVLPHLLLIVAAICSMPRVGHAWKNPAVTAVRAGTAYTTGGGRQQEFRVIKLVVKGTPEELDQVPRAITESARNVAPVTSNIVPHTLRNWLRRRPPSETHATLRIESHIFPGSNHEEGLATARRVVGDRAP